MTLGGIQRRSRRGYKHTIPKGHIWLVLHTQCSIIYWKTAVRGETLTFDECAWKNIYLEQYNRLGTMANGLH